MIKKLIYPCIALVCLIVLNSCSSKKPPPPVPQWLYEKDAIILKFKADRILNVSDGDSHTLLLCTYQLQNESMLNQLAMSEDGIHQLLDCDRFDSSVKNSNQFIFQPGQDLTFIMDRLAGTQKIALVAGYSNLQKERMVRVVDIPVLISEDNKVATVEKLKAVVHLGSEQIAAIQSY